MIDYKSFAVLTFDCYGTIIDWERGILRTLRPVLDAHGVEIADAEILEQYAGFEAQVECGPYLRYADVLRSVLTAFGEFFGFSPTDDELARFFLTVSEAEWRRIEANPPNTLTELQHMARGS